MPKKGRIACLQQLTGRPDTNFASQAEPVLHDTKQQHTHTLHCSSDLTAKISLTCIVCALMLGFRGLGMHLAVVSVKSGHLQLISLLREFSIILSSS